MYVFNIYLNVYLNIYKEDLICCEYDLERMYYILIQLFLFVYTL